MIHPDDFGPCRNIGLDPRVPEIPDEWCDWTDEQIERELKRAKEDWQAEWHYNREK